MGGRRGQWLLPRALLTTLPFLLVLQVNAAGVRSVGNCLGEDRNQPWCSPRTLDLCDDPSVDTIFTGADNNLYVFKGDYYYKLNDWGVEPGYPKLIGDTWRSLPGGIDAAFTKNGRTYFFKGPLFWKYEGFEPAASNYPKLIRRAFRGIPDNLDAASYLIDNTTIYFFKGSRFWTFTPSRVPMVMRKNISCIEGAPQEVNAALRIRDNAFLFLGHHHVRLDPTGCWVEVGPRDNAQLWFGCPAPKPLEPPPVPPPFGLAPQHHTLPPLPLPFSPTPPPPKFPDPNRGPPRNPHVDLEVSTRRPFPAPRPLPPSLLALSQTLIIPTEKPPPEQPLESVHLDLCRDPRPDAVFADGNRTLFFKGNLFYSLNGYGVESGYPKRISEVWQGLPGDIDAAFNSLSGKTFFFKGPRYWRFTGKRLDHGFPRLISKDFERIPDDLDAAFAWGERIFFFKGTFFWKYDPHEIPPVGETYPNLLNNWAGVGNWDHIDAAGVLQNQTYIFRGDQYFRFNMRMFQVDISVPQFPRPVARWWLGCPADLPPPPTTPTSTTPRITVPTTPKRDIELEMCLKKRPAAQRRRLSPRAPLPRRAAPDLCRDASVDAVFSDENGVTVVFKGEYFYRVGECGPDEGRPIASQWRELAAGGGGSVDAAFADGGALYVLRGDDCWRYSGSSLNPGFPRLICEEFPGIPDDLDAAMQWDARRHVFFFKGNMFWKFVRKANPPVGNMYPNLVSIWAGIPNHVDAAAVLHNRTYFFKGDQYYRFDERSFAVAPDDPPYPQSTAYLFGCSRRYTSPHCRSRTSTNKRSKT